MCCGRYSCTRVQPYSSTVLSIINVLIYDKRTVFSMKNVPGYRKRTRSGEGGVKTYQVPQLPKRTGQEYSKRTVVTGNEYKP